MAMATTRRFSIAPVCTAGRPAGTWTLSITGSRGASGMSAASREYKPPPTVTIAPPAYGPGSCAELANDILTGIITPAEKQAETPAKAEAAKDEVAAPGGCSRSSPADSRCGCNLRLANTAPRFSGASEGNGTRSVAV